jgi:hypothetical protein
LWVSHADSFNPRVSRTGSKIARGATNAPNIKKTIHQVERSIGRDSIDRPCILHANPLGMPIGTAAKTGGIKNYFVEMDLPLMQASVPYLRHLQVQ